MCCLSLIGSSRGESRNVVSGSTKGMDGAKKSLFYNSRVKLFTKLYLNAYNESIHLFRYCTEEACYSDVAAGKSFFSESIDVFVVSSNT